MILNEVRGKYEPASNLAIKMTKVVAFVREVARMNAMNDKMVKEQVVSAPEIVADDDRGIIEKLVDGNYASVLRITSQAGSVRANHYHQYDSHMCYLVSGKLRYVHRPALDDKATLEEVIIEPGQLFFTPSMVAHAMEFLEDSEFYAFTTQGRGQDQYENDVIRVTLIEPK